MIISIIGNCSTGKTTLGRYLQRHYKISFYPIEYFRNKYKDELIAWAEMRRLIKRFDRPSRKVVISSLGLNPFYKWVTKDLKYLLIVKLFVNDPKILIGRTIKRRDREGYFVYGVDKINVIKRKQKDFKNIKTDLFFDTSRCPTKEIAQSLIDYLNSHRIKKLPKKKITLKEFKNIFKNNF